MDYRHFKEHLMIQKKEMFLEYVKRASESIGSPFVPKVNFGYCPESTSDIAHIHLDSGVICISEYRLESMTYEDIQDTATHEVAHLVETSHNGKFVNTHVNIKSSIWTPSLIITGNKIKKENEASIYKEKNSNRKTSREKITEIEFENGINKVGENEMTKELTLRIAESHHRDVGRDIARMERDNMELLDLVSGDYIEISGKDTTYATVWPAYPEDRGMGLLRIDGYVRNNAKISLDDVAIIRKADLKEAKMITLAPTQHVRLVGGAQYIHRLLEGRSIKKGQQIRVETVNNPINFVVVTTQPTGPVFVGKNTQINLMDEVLEVSEFETPFQTTYDDIGGLSYEINQVKDMVELPLIHPELFMKIGSFHLKSILLYGPSGTGKTLLAKAVANETDANFVSLNPPEIISKYYGESETHLRDMFDEAEKNAPTIIFIDEIDCIAQERSKITGEVERRIVTQLFSLLDRLEMIENVFFIAATNRVESLDIAFRRRIDREIEFQIPDNESRFEILQIYTKNMPLSQDIDLNKIAGMTDGYVGADIKKLVMEATLIAIHRSIPNINYEISNEVLNDIQVKAIDFEESMKNIKPYGILQMKNETE